MPKIATYDRDPVRRQIVTQPQASTAGGDAVFAANRQLIDQVQKTGEFIAQQKQEVDTARAEEALVNFERDQNDFFFNEENGYFNTQGVNALDGAEGARTHLEDLRRQYGETLNPQAKALFDQASQVRLDRGFVDISRHAAKGKRVYEMSNQEAYIENSLEQASLRWSQPEELITSMATGVDSIRALADMEGVTGKALDERYQNFRSAFAVNAVTAATQSSSQEGQMLFDKMSKSMKLEPQDKLKLERAITSKKEAEKVQADAQLAVVTSTNLVDKHDSREDIRQEVNKIKDPELRKKTMSEAMQQFNQKKRGEQEARVQAFEDAENHVFEGGTVESYKATDPEGWQRLTAKQKRSLESGANIETDWNVYTDIMQMTDSELADMDINEVADKLAPTERKAVVREIDAARKKQRSQSGRSRTAQTTAAIEQMFGKQKKDWNDDRREKANNFYMMLDSEMQSRVEEKGRELSSQEYTQLLKDMTGKVIIEDGGLWFFDDEQSVTDIDPDRVKQIADYLRANGREVTSASIIAVNQQLGE